MRRTPKLVTGALVVALASATVVPTAGAAGQSPAPRAHSAGLLDGLGTPVGSLLNGVLGSGQQQQLQQLLGLLQNGQQPTSSLLAPLHTVLGQIAATPGLPAQVRTLVGQVDALVQSNGTGTLAPGVLAPVATLVHGLADTGGLPAQVSGLLDDVADALGTGDLPALPVGQLSLDPDVVAQAASALTSVANGQEPTGTLLAPVGALLDQVAATSDLPPALGDLMSQFGDTIEGTAGSLDPLFTSELSTMLSMIGNTPGTPGALRTVIQRSSTSMSSSTSGGGTTTAAAKAKARQATNADKAVIKVLRVNRARTLVTARIACPRGAPATCATASRATLGGRRAVALKRTRIGRGGHKTVQLHIARAAHVTAVQHGGVLRFKVTTKFGTRTFSTTRTLHLARAAGHHGR